HTSRLVQTDIAREEGTETYDSSLDNGVRHAYHMHSKYSRLEGAMAKPTGADTRMRTSLLIPRDLLHRLKVAAAEEQTDVSRLLCRIAEDYLKTRKGGRR